MSKTKSELLQDIEKMQKDLEKAEKKERPQRYTWFTMVIYPRENDTNCHGYVLAYVERMKVLFDKYAYAEHLNDRWTEDDEKEDPEHKAGELKKPHTHVIFHVTEPITIKGMEKRFAHKCDKCIKACSDPRSAVLYLTHETFECEMEGKYKYPHEIVKGTTELLKILEQNANFVQKELIEIIHDNAYLYDCEKFIRDEYSGRTQESLIDELHKSAYFQRMSNQEVSRHKFYSTYEERKYRQHYNACKDDINDNN